MHGVRGLLADRRYRRYFLARTVSVFGSTMAPLALAFAVLGLGERDQVTELGVVMLFRFLAQAVFALWGGVLADRFSRQRTMVIADLAAGATQVVLATVVISGHASIPALIVLSFLNGIAISMFLPAADGVLPLLMPPSRVKDAAATTKAGQNTARILGAAGAGLLVALFGPGWALMVDAATFLVSAALLAGLALPVTARAERHSMLADMRGGLREVTSREWMWVSLLQWAVLNFCNAGGIFVLGPVLAERHYAGAIGWSAALGAQMVGFLVGSGVALRLNPPRPLATATLWTLAWTPPLIALGLAAPWWVFVATMFVAGTALEIGEVLATGVSLTNIPEEALSRVGAIQTALSFALVPLGFAAVGPISGWLGTSSTLLIYAAVMVLATGAAMSSRSLRTITVPDDEPDGDEQEPAIEGVPVERTTAPARPRRR